MPHMTDFLAADPDIRMGATLPGATVDLIDRGRRRRRRRVSRGITQYHPPKTAVSPRICAFIGFSAERFGQPRYWERA
jgi:hypothetical protein